MSDETVMIEWTSKELAAIRRVQNDAKARRELYDRIEAGLKDAKDRLAIQQDALTALAGKIAEGGATFDEAESSLVADAIGAWLLSFAREDIKHAVFRDDLSREPNERRYAYIGHGRIWT